MIYSILQHKEVPVRVTKEVNFIDDKIGNEIVYTVHDAKESRIHIGYVKLEDTKNGAHVSFIKNQHPKLYKHFGQVADQIELEHCLNRGLDNPQICSVAARGTYVNHFLRGKRFINEGINVYLDYLTKDLKKGEKVFVEYLGCQKMYMPINLINELKEKIKINPLLKGIK